MLKGKRLFSQKGFSLLEILVALILLTVAVLGSVKLASVALKSSDSTILRQKSVVLIDDLFARMRTGKPTEYVMDTTAGGVVDCSTHNNLTSQQEWLRQLDCMIPGAKAQVEIGNSNQVTATIIWDDRRGKMNDKAEQDTYQVSLSTVIMN